MARQIWEATNILDQKGKVVIVISLSSGIGLETIRGLASKNAAVIELKHGN